MQTPGSGLGRAMLIVLQDDTFDRVISLHWYEVLWPEVQQVF